MVGGAVAETKTSRLERLLPGGKGVWIPIDHGASDFLALDLKTSSKRFAVWSKQG